MRILVINPNISESVTGIIEAEAIRVAGPDTELVFRTAAFGFEYIETRFESLVAAHAVAEEIADGAADCDAVVVAAFGDPGLPALKEIVDIPVVGITEAALHTAALLSPKFSIVAISERITSWYLDCVDRNGLRDRLCSIRSLSSVIPDIGAVKEDSQEALLKLVNQCVSDGADGVILAGAPLGGLARDVQACVQVPLVDGVCAGILQAELLVRMGVSAHRTGSLSFPPRKPTKGLSVQLQALMEAGYDASEKRD